MAHSNWYLSRKAKEAILIIMMGIVAGLLYAILQREYNHLGKMFNGLVIGLLSGGAIVLNEIVYNRASSKRFKFSNLVIYKTILYSIIFTVIPVVVISIQRAIESDMSLVGYLSSSSSNFVWNEDLHIIVLYTLTVTAFFIFFHQMSKKMGQGVLMNFISGKYHRAREEERIFMFMDLNHSTSLAEELGDLKFNKLLNDFFFDITQSIISNYGEIYRYVGDEIVVSWRLKKGLDNANFVRALFQAEQALYKKREYYLNTFGFSPSFSVGFNYGKVIIGEIGEVKSQISFFGDVMYETPEIEKACKKYNTTNLIPEKLLDMIDLPVIFQAKKEGMLDIRGYDSIQVYSIKEK